MKEPFIDLEGNPGEMETAIYQLEVSYTHPKEQIHEDALIHCLFELSRRKVSIGVSGVILYAYFDDKTSAEDAALNMVRIADVETSIRAGSFNVSGLIP